MKDALTGIAFGVLVVAGVLGLMWLASVIPDPAPAQPEPTLPVTVDGLFGAAWLFGLAVLPAAVMVRNGLMEIADAIRESREGTR